MSTSDLDTPQQTAFLTSATSGLVTMTSIYNGSSSAPPTLTAMTADNNTPSSTLVQGPNIPPNPPSSTGTNPVSSSKPATGLTASEGAGIGVGSAAVLAIFLWWFWPKRRTNKKRPDISTSVAPDIKQSSATTEVEKADRRHLSTRVKTV